MESSVRGADGDDPAKGVDSFLEGANMSLLSFEPSLQVLPDDDNEDDVQEDDPGQHLASPKPVNKAINKVVAATPTINASTGTPPLTVADLAGPSQHLHPAQLEIDDSPLLHRQPAPVTRRKPASARTLSFRIPDDDDKFDIPEALLKKLDESDTEESAAVDTTKAGEGDDTIASLPTQRRPSRTYGQTSPSKSSLFQTPAAVRSTMNRLPTETAISQRIRDVEVPRSVMKELESDKRLLGLNERNDKSGVLTLREQGAVIDKLRKENFGLKIKVFYLEGKINQQYDEASRDVMKEVVPLTLDVAYGRTSNSLEP
jgi:Centrosomin N-terminal motif 1